MRFRPCIDIHEGKVKQIIGGTLRDRLPDTQCAAAGKSTAEENFVSQKDASWYASLFRKDHLTGGHIIMLGSSPENQKAALSALSAWPGGMQVGGGMHADNAFFYLDAGASHIIVTSYIFRDGIIDYHRLTDLAGRCGKQRIVLDLSCRPVSGGYRIATNRWQTLSDTWVTHALLNELAAYCGEFLVHAVSKEGLKSGIDETLISLLAESPVPVTYAGGISSLEDIEKIRLLGRNQVDYTVGSALDLFGGYISYQTLAHYANNHKSDSEDVQ